MSGGDAKRGLKKRRNTRREKFILDAVRNNDLQELQMLLENGPLLDGIVNEMCLLCLAVELNRIEFVQYLLERGADIHFECPHGSPLYKAVQESNLNILRVLLNGRGKRPNHVSCIITALYNGDVEIVETLLQHGSDVNGQIHSQGRSPFKPINVPYWLPRMSEPPSYKYQFENMETPTEKDVIGYNDLSGGRPLHMAIVRRLGAAVSLLLDYGADVNAPTDKGYTPLLQAVRTFFPKPGTYHFFHPHPNDSWKECNIIPALLRAGARVFAEDFRQNFCLGFFLRDETPFILRSFLAHKFPAATPPSSEEVLQSVLHQAQEGRICQHSDLESPYPLRWYHHDLDRAEISLAHIAWLETAGTLTLGNRPVPDVSLNDRATSTTQQVNDFFDKCKDEVERLKATTLTVDDDINVETTTSYSVFDLLTGGDVWVWRLARNSGVTRLVTSDDFDRIFPIYGGYVKERLRKRNIRGEHVNEILRVFRRSPSCLAEIPAEPMELILCHLNTQELRLLVQAFAPMRRYN